MMAQLVVKARQRLTSLAGVEFSIVFLPLIILYLIWIFQESEAIQMTFAEFSGQISIHPPKHKLLRTLFQLIEKSKRSEVPLQALTVFTDGSGHSHKSVTVQRDTSSSA